MLLAEQVIISFLIETIIHHICFRTCPFKEFTATMMMIIVSYKL